MAKVIDKKIKLTLVGLDGNSFGLLGAFRRQARKEKWAAAEIKAVEDEAMRGDYDYLLVTLMDHCEDSDDDDEDYEYGGES